jgi:hypothetical protein
MIQAPGVDISRVSCDVPSGYAAVPLGPAQERAMLKLCALVRRKVDAQALGTGGALVLLRQILDGRVYLGCITDLSGKVQKWVELWVQEIDGVADTAAAYRESINNHSLDERWIARCKSMAKIGTPGGGLVWLGFEDKNPAPIVVDPEFAQGLEPTESRSGRPWALCTDDRILQAKGFPPYSSTLSRCLWVPDLGEQSPFAAVTTDVEGAGAAPLAEAVGKSMAMLNPGGGLMMCRGVPANSYEEHIDVLSSGGRGENKKFGDPLTGGWALVGLSGRLAESFHLKVRLIVDAIAAVRDLVAETQTPCLNITPASFGVSIGEKAWGLPHLWTARAIINDPGDAIQLPIKGSDAVYYVPGKSAGPTIYAPPSAGRGVRGRGSMRIRKVSESAAGVVAEATLSTQERMNMGRNDLIWLRGTVGNVRMDLYATPEQGAAVAGGELRVRTLPMRLTPDATEQLLKAEGVVVGDVMFEVVPLISTPCDLYALAVLAARTLLVGGQGTLAVVLDEIQSLGAQLASSPAAEGASLASRVRAVVQSNAHWAEALGPQRLLREELSADDALGVVPIDLWCDALGAMIRMFPGVGPDSLSKDFGDAPVGSIHRVFDRALEDWGRVLRASRSLVLNDLGTNRELAGLLRRAAPGAAGGRRAEPALRG